jgi:hypothetical protein
MSVDDEAPEVKLTIELKCPECGTPWESFAAINAPLKKPKLLIL